MTYFDGLALGLAISFVHLLILSFFLLQAAIRVERRLTALEQANEPHPLDELAQLQTSDKRDTQA